MIIKLLSFLVVFIVLTILENIEKRGKPKRPCMGIAILLAVMALAGPRPAYAEPFVLDQFSVTLLGHMETVLEANTHGKTNAAVLATPIQVGKWDGAYIAGADFGVLGNVKPQTIGQEGYNWTTGIHLHLSPFIRRAVPKISPAYPALAALEINPRVSYTFRNRTNEVKAGWQFGLGLGWAFGAEPVQ